MVIFILISLFAIICGVILINIFIYKHDHKYPYGYTKVMKDGNGMYAVVGWAYESGDWYGDGMCGWNKVVDRYSELDDAIKCSEDINDKCIYNRKSNMLYDIEI